MEIGAGHGGGGDDRKAVLQGGAGLMVTSSNTNVLPAPKPITALDAAR